MTDSADPDFEQIMATSTAPYPVQFHLAGFAKEEDAQKLANLTATFVQYIGTKLNLQGLDGITIAFDYNKALVDLDRGYETSFVLTPSSEFVQGVAMSPAVIREGTIKTHIVFAAGVFAGFVDTDNELWRGLYYQLAHECGHVHDRRAFDIAFPNFLLTRYEFEDHLDAWYFQMGDGSRCEYTASRLSAEFDPDQIALHEESFMLVFEGLGARIEALEEAFVEDGDGTKLFTELSKEYERILRHASYVLGHVDGLQGDMTPAPKFKAFIESDHWLAEYITKLHDTLKEIWAKYGEWTSLSDLEQPGVIVQLLLARNGVKLHLHENGEVLHNRRAVVFVRQDWRAL
jgi:hypothetical protein